MVEKQKDQKVIDFMFDPFLVEYNFPGPFDRTSDDDDDNGKNRKSSSIKLIQN